MLIAKADLKNSIEIFKRASAQSEPVIFSTDTIYGIGAPISDKLANQKIFELKGRDRTKPFPILIADFEQFSEICSTIESSHLDVLKKIWPAPVTVVVKASEKLDSIYTLNGTVAVRMPGEEWLRDLIKETHPISATSANLAGEAYTGDITKIIESFSSVKYYLVYPAKRETSSTIIDMSGSKISIIREGADAENISKFIK